MQKFLVLVVVLIIAAFGYVVVASQIAPKPASQTNLGINPTERPPIDLGEPLRPITLAPSPPPQQPTPTTPPQSSSGPANVVNKRPTAALIETSKGQIVIFFHEETPKTVSNFTEKAKSGAYNNLTFHRVEDWVAQGGDPKGDGTGGGTMATEITNKPFVVGSVGVARGSDIKVSNDMQFFITKKEAPWLFQQYTNFGIVARGIDVVNKLQIGDKIVKITME